MYTINDALKFTLTWEGGYSNHVADPGGATNYGITQRTYDSYRHIKGLKQQSVANIGMDEVGAIYDSMYWTVSHSKWLPAPLALAMFDTAVNFGVAGAIRRLQKALGLAASGTWTEETSEAVHKADPVLIAREIVKLRIAHRHWRVQQKPSQKVFLRGWLRRDNALLAAVNALAGPQAMSFSEDDILDMLAHDIDAETLSDVSTSDEANANRASAN